MTGADATASEAVVARNAGPRPQVAVVEITNRCNLQCVHCGSSSGDARCDELSTDEFQRALDELASLGCELVTLLGGEIFLRRDWSVLAEHVQRLGIRALTFPCLRLADLELHLIQRIPV